jgi:hypothetical protein
MNMWLPKYGVILKLIRNIPVIKRLDKVQIAVELSLLQFSVAGKRTRAVNMAGLIVHHTHAPLSAHRLITCSYRGATLFFVWNSKWRFRFCIRRNLFVRCGSWDAVQENHSRILQYFFLTMPLEILYSVNESKIRNTERQRDLGLVFVWCLLF